MEPSPSAPPSAEAEPPSRPSPILAHERPRSATQQALLTGSLYGVAAHGLQIGIFAALRVWPLSALNVLSVLLFGLSYFMFRRGRFTLGSVIITVELCVYQAVAVHSLGWQSGFQYWLLASVPLYFLLPERWRWLSFTEAGAVSLVLCALWWRYARAMPLYSLPPRAIDVMSLANHLGACMLVALVPRVFARTVERAEVSMRKLHQQTEALLFNTLPMSIAERLRHAPGTLAESRSEVTVLFADIVGFTPLAERTPPGELVNLLDDIFSRFDALVDRFRLEKIKTIGDAYMVASGVPVARADHAQAAARLALAMRAALDDVARERGLPLSMRIGLHSGAVVAGVIGRRKFAYDLWGDTVNTAARLESHGLPGEIHLSESTRDALATDADRWDLIERGVIELKGKGPMRTFFLRGERGAQDAR